MEIILAAVVVAVVFYTISKIQGPKTLLSPGVTHTQQLEFSLSEAVLKSPVILTLAGLTKKEYKEDFDKWPTSRKRKWQAFLKSKTSHFDFGELNFELTYLSHDDVFMIEWFSDGQRYTSIRANRSPNNTYLFDKTLVHYPTKSKDLDREHIRLEVKLREDDDYYLISIGLREFKEKSILSGSDYTKLFDFPFAKRGLMKISDEEYNKFGFKIKRPSPWYEKDDFGKHVAHPWDTQVEYKHESGTKVIYQF